MKDYSPENYPPVVVFERALTVLSAEWAGAASPGPRACKGHGLRPEILFLWDVPRPSRQYSLAYGSALKAFPSLSLFPLSLFSLALALFLSLSLFVSLSLSLSLSLYEKEGFGA